ncbi:LysR family transcriptional regulator [Aliivibrio fischeri]|uniref:LysR family transcriptional regulator n=1 Tax=Aliivibrio fischeri TaxID=668 RepID=UPI001F2A206B|nr:LysR family transcriptional regulator [Aliivibrio fischeri]MCE7553680.1 LysR family transcriptional regulator [Aliivibrio fischeri]MCE7561468.1 LysR family transcriptional regulator [Aliivibrio fischeri]MCE7568876.1 LysR family transcriptional regulator [Aliivibrio fischeri]
MKSTELNLIPIFVAIYEEKNLSKAAIRMNISQPAVSKALKRLREIYDDGLFHRNTTGVEPTVFASDIYPAMSAALKNFTSTLSASREFDPKTSNRIFSIAVVSTVNYSLIPKLVKQLRLSAPNISLEIHPQFTEDLESDLRLQRYDLVIDMAIRGRTILKSEVVYTEILKVVCSKDHPRIGDSISLEQFLSEEHVAASRWHSRSSLLNAEDIGELEARNIVIRAAGAFEMMPIIGSTEMIGMLPQSTLDDLGDYYNLKSLDLPFNRQQHDLCSIWHPSRSNDSGHRWLRQQIQKAAKNDF